MVIRTNSFETKLTVNAPEDTVRHFDFASSVDVLAIKDQTYEEFGTVGRVEIKQGRVEAMDGCEIFCMMEDPAAEDTKVNEGAILHTNMQNINAEEGVVKDPTTGVGNGHIDDCGAGRHSFSQLVVDSEHVYDVCTCCGYALVKVMDETGNSVKQTLNTLEENEEGRMVATEDGEKTTPIATYLKEGEPFETTTNEQGETIVDISKLPAGNITVTEEQKIEETPVVVSVDENGKPIAIDRTCKHEFKYSDFDHEGDDICLGTCKHCSLQIKTQHDWWVITQLPGQTSYKGVCSKCGCERDSNVVTIGEGGSYDTVPAALAFIHEQSSADEYTAENPYKATLKLVDNEQYNISGSALTINANEDITLELNGFKLTGYAIEGKFAGLITNNGKLAIKDSSDTKKDGTGTGLLEINALNPDTDPVPGFASPVISNHGVLNVESGYIRNKTTGTDGGAPASFAIDNITQNYDKLAVLNISGGRFSASAAMAIRQYDQNNSGENHVSISGGVVEHGFWLQDGNNTNGGGTLTITGGTFIGSGLADAIQIGYSGESKGFDIVIKNCKLNGNLKFVFTDYKSIDVDIDSIEITNGIYIQGCIDLYIESNIPGMVNEKYITTAIVGVDYSYDFSVDLTGAVCNIWIDGADEKYVDQQYIHINGSILSIDGEALVNSAEGWAYIQINFPEE